MLNGELTKKNELVKGKEVKQRYKKKRGATYLRKKRITIHIFIIVNFLF